MNEQQKHDIAVLLTLAMNALDYAEFRAYQLEEMYGLDPEFSSDMVDAQKRLQNGYHHGELYAVDTWLEILD